MQRKWGNIIMNQLFEFAINSSNNVIEAYNKLWHVSGGFTTLSVNDILSLQKWYLYNSRSTTATKLIDFLCLEGKLPVYDHTIYADIFNRNSTLFHNMWNNGILSLMYFDLCNYEFGVLADAELSFLIGMAENREELGEYVASSIDNWIDKNWCITNLNDNIRQHLNVQRMGTSIAANEIEIMSITEELKEIVSEGFLNDEFTIKNINEPLNLIKNPRLHGDLIYYLTGLHRKYNSFMFKHPYWCNITDFVDSIIEDIETGIQYGVLEYYIDDTERRIVYDKEVDAAIYTFLTASIRRNNN